MALIKCPECGKEYSDSAYRCPNCGKPSEKTERKYDFVWEIVILLLFLISFWIRYYFLWVIGIVLMWVKKIPGRIVSRIIMTVFFGLLILVFALAPFIKN